MYFQQSDILRGVGRDFLKKFIDIAVKESHRAGYLLFREGDRASDFFIMLKGKVNLTIGDSGHIVYTIDYPGEAFGWSCLRLSFLGGCKRAKSTKKGIPTIVKFNDGLISYIKIC